MKIQLIITLGILFFFGCAKSSSSTAVKVQTQNEKTCVPESELLSSGIVGGTTVSEQDRDSKNVIMIYADGQICTSTAISRRVLLTAAHCVAAAEKTFAIMHSSLSCESGFDSRYDRVAVSQFIAHENYKSDRSTEEYSVNDIALVFLKDNLPSGYPIFKIADPSLVNAETLYFWGFGQTKNSEADAGAGMLRKTQLAPSTYTINLDRKKIIVDQSGGHGICHGDSGGPGLVQQNGEFKILGVNSYVAGSNDANLCNGEAYLTLANSFVPWIQHQLKIQNEVLPN